MEDGDGVDAGTGDGPHALTWNEDGLASVGGGDGVGATSGGLTGIDTEDGDGVDDVRPCIVFSSQLSLSHWSHVTGVEEGQRHLMSYLYIEK